MKLKKTIILIISAVLLFASCASAEKANKIDTNIIYKSPSLSAKQIGYQNELEASEVLEIGENVIVNGTEYFFWIKIRTKDDVEGWVIMKKRNKTNSDSFYNIERNGTEVTARKNSKELTGNEWKDFKDPSATLAAFFISYLSQTDEWKNLIADFGDFDSKEELIAERNRPYEEFYGRVDSLSITINPLYFKNYGNGTALYTVSFGFSYDGNLGAGDDQVSMIMDENGNWLIEKLPL